jgi:hypothetical protein
MIVLICDGCSSSPLSTPHAEFLQDSTIIREPRLTALCY